MSRSGILPWETFERWCVKLVFLGAVLLAGAAVIVFYDVVQGTELRLPLGQVFVGSGWAIVLLGLLGLYPRLADRRPWLARVSAFFAGVGVYGYAVMAVIFAAGVAGLPESIAASYEPVFFPAVLAGTFLAFPLFAVAGLLTGAYSRGTSILLGAPPVIFVVNVLTGPSAESIFGVVVALIVVFGMIGYQLQRGGVTTDQTHSPADTSV